MTDTIDALDALTTSEGWRILCDAARREWAERERVGVKNVLGAEQRDDLATINKLRQIVAAREAVEWVLALPGQEMARLRRQQTDSTSSTATVRPLSVPQELIGMMSRRGSL